MYFLKLDLDHLKLGLGNCFWWSPLISMFKVVWFWVNGQTKTKTRTNSHTDGHTNSTSRWAMALVDAHHTTNKSS